MINSPNTLYIIVILFFSIVIHEVAHGYMALRCGDTTARDMGRITLNPISHIDIFGTIIVPMILIFTGSPIMFGWAKPVPINPYNFRNYKQDTIKVGISGVLANFLLAIIFSLIIWIVIMMKMHQTSNGQMYIAVLSSGVYLNIILGLFNLIPIPPLDGSRVVSALLPSEIAGKYAMIEPYGFFILIFTLNIIWWPIIRVATYFIMKLLFMGLPL